MQNFEKNLLKTLLTQIRIELVATSTQSEHLKPNTHLYNSLTQKIENWQKQLKPIINKAKREQHAQNLRQQSIHNLPSRYRYSEKQSINDNLKNIGEVKRQIEQAEQAISELLLNALNPSDFEILFNAIKQCKSEKDWSQKLTKLNEMTNTNQGSETTTLLKEASDLKNHYRHNAHTSPGIMPIQSMLLVVMGLLVLTQKVLRDKKL